MHPPQSPDLNPIENLWTVMKAELHKNPASSIHDLKVKLKEIWYSIDNEILKFEVNDECEKHSNERRSFLSKFQAKINKNQQSTDVNRDFSLGGAHFPNPL
uniref:AlNc14C221G9100 protein n=1 Tax=Albugo laibachii Nc14 TaxID=890382 RepID=F0WRV8_9STRA|nr:AlNc14C221G9100 [Albugo laibachii Nc14]|eukprot:CCA24074.1 AlNc14C221G9100 [Albugo laibachii Nc14]